MSAPIPTTTHYSRIHTLAAANTVITHLSHIAFTAHPVTFTWLPSGSCVEAEWHVLTLLKIHVRTSHVSCLTHIFGGAGGGGGGGGGEGGEGAVGANPQPLEAVAQYPTNICA